jgi:hypothetical protein
MQNKELKEYISLPLLASLSIWLACNSSIFQDKGMPSFQCDSHIRVTFSSIKIQDTYKGGQTKNIGAPFNRAERGQGLF